MYLIDSDYLIYFLKGRTDAVELITGLSDENLFTSVICVGEVLEGLLLNRQRKRKKQFEGFIETLKVLDVDLQVVRQFADLRKTLRRRGQLIDNFDLLIASSCMVHGLSLVTANTKHFKRVPGLKLYKG